MVRPTTEATRATGGHLVPLPAPAPDPEPLADPRHSDVDEWGRSERMRALARAAFGPFYDHWFRVEWEGLEKIPTDGGALLVANHAGAIPSDAPVIMHGIETELERAVYGLADEMFKKMPVVGTLWSRAGGVLAHPDNAYRLLREQRELVLVFPEGSKGPGKTYNERYQLRRFGRGGFVQIAMRAGVPVIPIAVVGAEESMPTLANMPRWPRRSACPTPPSRRTCWRSDRCSGRSARCSTSRPSSSCKVLDPVYFDVPPDQPRYSRSKVMDESEAIRQQIQETLYEMLRARRSVWSG